MNPAARVSNRTLLALAAFGITSEPRDTTPPLLAESIATTLSPRDRVLITGPSASGKSRLGRAIAAAAALQARRVVRIDPSQPHSRGHARMLDVIPGPIPRAWSLLSRVGLADATLLSRRIHELSEGESFRLLIARALAREPDVLVVDEFCSALDSRLARSVCLSLCARAPCALIAITAREDVARWFPAHTTITCTRTTAPTLETAA